MYLSFWAPCPASVECNKNGIWFKNYIYDLTGSVENARVPNSAVVTNCEIVLQSDREGSKHH